jgi:hypothetical protein
LRLSELFRTLPTPTLGSDLPSFATIILEKGPHRLCKDLHGAPALLVATESSSSSPRPAPIELEYVKVTYDAPCVLWHSPGSYDAAKFSLVQCSADDKALCDYFLSVSEGVLPLLGPAPSRDSVREIVESIAQLFRALTLPPKTTIQGLWAELFIMAESLDPHSLGAAWRVASGDAYDFSASSQRLEVKSSGTRERKHHFTFDQLHPPRDTQVLVASLFVERAGAGTTLGQLLDSIRSRLAPRPDLVLRIEQVVAASLGTSWRNALDQRFDNELARDSLAFFEAHQIPSVDPPLPRNVSEVRFVSDFADISPVAFKTLLATEGIFRATVPIRRA